MLFFLFIVGFQGVLNQHYFQKITYSYHKRQREAKKTVKEVKTLGKEIKAEQKREAAQKIGFGLGITQKEQPKAKPQYSHKLTLSLNDNFKRRR